MLLKKLFLVLLVVFIYQHVDAQSLSAPNDGISYEIIKNYTKLEPKVVECGYNDAGGVKIAQVTYQTRKYQERKDGKIVKVWIKEEQLKIECLQNQ